MLQEMLQVGDILILVILFLDKTYLINFLGNKKAQVIYMTLGNLLSNVQNLLTNYAIALLALLLVLPKKEKLSTEVKDHIARLI